MLIVALVLAVIGLAALITAVVTSNELVAWVCIAASALGVVLLIVDAIRERKQSRLAALTAQAEDAEDAEGAPLIADSENTEFIEYSAEVVDPVSVDPVIVDPVIVDSVLQAEDHPEELVHDEPEYDLPSDDEPEFAASAEESAIHIVDEQSAVEPAGDDEIVVLQADDAQVESPADSTAVIEYGDTGYDRDDR
jgi:hypothetical protein